MSTRLLFIGDLHLGRTPHRLAAAGIDLARLGPAEAWRSAVDHAVTQHVDAVVLAGDVVDQDDDRFEAYAHLERGVRRLVDAGILVYGVAGNHDHVALPRLAARLPGFHLLGQDAHWERVAVGQVDLVGWSFPQRHHRHNPLDSAGLQAAVHARDLDRACLAVLHGDLDGPVNSPYAPVPRAALEALGLDACLLGHVHRPGTLEGPRPVGYLGSLVGLDRGETGRHGPWEVHVDASDVRLTHLELGPVRWTTIDLDVTELHLDAAADDELHAALESVLKETSKHLDLPSGIKVVGCSVRWTGRTSHAESLARFQRERRDTDLCFVFEGLRWIAVSFEDLTRPAHDLAALATERTPVGRIARLLLDLDTTGAAAIPQPVHTEVQHLRADTWTPWDEPPSPPSSVDLTRRAAVNLLDRLLLQRRHAEAQR